VKITAIRTTLVAMLFVAGSAVAGTIPAGNDGAGFEKANVKGSFGGDVKNSQLDLVLTLQQRDVGAGLVDEVKGAGAGLAGNVSKFVPMGISVVDVPEPATPLTVALGLGLVALMARRRRN
jgi:hypothetical protein